MCGHPVRLDALCMTLHTVTEDRRPHTTARTLAVGGFAGFILFVLIATMLQPGSYRWTRDYISGLAAMDAAYPVVMVAGFQFAAIGVLATAVVVVRVLPRLSARIAAALLLVAGLALSVAGFARFDCSRNDAACRAQVEAGMSWHSQLHGRAALFVFLPLILAGVFLAVAVLRTRSPYRIRLGVAAAVLAAANFGLTFAVEEQATDVTGLLQRVLVFTLLGLPVMVAVGRWRFPGDDVSERSERAIRLGV
jgi:hypothetical protein